MRSGREGGRRSLAGPDGLERTASFLPPFHAAAPQRRSARTTLAMPILSCTMLRVPPQAQQTSRHHKGLDHDAKNLATIAAVCLPYLILHIERFYAVNVLRPKTLPCLRSPNPLASLSARARGHVGRAGNRSAAVPPPPPGSGPGPAERVGAAQEPKTILFSATVPMRSKLPGACRPPRQGGEDQRERAAPDPAFLRVPATEPLRGQCPRPDGRRSVQFPPDRPEHPVPNLPDPRTANLPASLSPVGTACIFN